VRKQKSSGETEDSPLEVRLKLVEHISDFEAKKRLMQEGMGKLKEITVIDGMIKILPDDAQKEKIRLMLKTNAPLEEIIKCSGAFASEKMRARNAEPLSAVSQYSANIIPYAIKSLSEKDSKNIYLGDILYKEIEPKAKRKRAWGIARKIADFIALAAVVSFGYACFKHKEEVGKYFAEACSIHVAAPASDQKQEEILKTRMQKNSELAREIKEKQNYLLSLGKNEEEKKGKISALEKTAGEKEFAIYSFTRRAEQKETELKSLEKKVKESESALSLSAEKRQIQDKSYSGMSEELAKKTKQYANVKWEFEDIEKKLAGCKAELAKIEGINDGLKSKIKEDSNAYFNLGKEYYKNNDKQKAKLIMLKVVEVNPDHIGANSLLSSIYAEEKDMAKSVKYYEKANALIKEEENKKIKAGAGSYNWGLR